MVELPDTPAIRGMTARAVVAEAALVKVICTMAIDADFVGVLVSASDVTLLAWHSYMQADEREAREVMIEVGFRAPSRWGVALRAVGSEFAGMHVRCTVAAGAARFELLGGDDRRVTRVTVDFLVPPFERPFAIARVIEGSRQPLLFAMAVLALAAEAARVRVLAAVATLAISRHRILQAAAAMAIRAVDACVDAQQGEAGLLRMIELRSLPARGRVAVGAFRAALAAMHVVGRMTGNALLRRALVAIAEMTGEARNLLVPVAQWERRLVVVEADVPPGCAVVAARTVASQLALVRFLSSMTRVAIGRRFAEALGFRVAAVARDSGVRAVQ